MKSEKKLRKNGYIDLPEFNKVVGCTDSGVRNFIKQGMPFEKTKSKAGRIKFMLNLEAAKGWLLANNKRVKGEVSPNFEKPKESTPPSEPAKQSNPIISGGNLDDYLSRVRLMEQEAFRDYLMAKKEGKDAITLRTRHRAYVETMSECRKSYNFKDEVDQAVLKLWEHIDECLTDWAMPFRVLIDAMPRSMAARCNPTDPSLAERHLKDWVENSLLPLMSRKVKKEIEPS